MSNQKSTIFLAGDSTVQSYEVKMAPQCGWGQALIRYFAGNEYASFHSEGSSFGNAVTYDSKVVRIDNRAMGARSTRTFLNEGRFDDMLPSMKEGDYLLMQFAHNDANKEKEERYVTPSEYQRLLKEEFIKKAADKGVIPILVTAIAMMEFEGDVCKISFPEYREAMLELSQKEKIGLIDLGKLTSDYNTRIGQEACKGIYLWTREGMFEGFSDGSKDTAHLQFAGAFAYGGLVYKELSKIMDLPE